MKTKQLIGIIVTGVVIIAVGVTGVVSNVISKKLLAESEEKGNSMVRQIFEGVTSGVELPDEEFIGEVWAMAVPPAVIAVALNSEPRKIVLVEPLLQCLVRDRLLELHLGNDASGEVDAEIQEAVSSNRSEDSAAKSDQQNNNRDTDELRRIADPVASPLDAIVELLLSLGNIRDLILLDAEELRLVIADAGTGQQVQQQLRKANVQQKCHHSRDNQHRGKALN